MVIISLLHSQFSYLGPKRIENILIIFHWHSLLCNLDFQHACPPLLNRLSALFFPTFFLIPWQSCSGICAASAVSNSWLPLTYWITSWIYVTPVNFSPPESEDEHFNQFLHSSKLTWLEWILQDSNFCCILNPAFFLSSLSFSFYLARETICNYFDRVYTPFFLFLFVNSFEQQQK